MTCTCGLPIVKGRWLPYAHSVNPGRNHHYPQLATRTGPNDLARGLDHPGSQGPSARLGSPVGVVTAPDGG